MIAMLMVMSGMDPHMISWNLGMVWFGWESGQSYCFGRTTIVASVVGSMSHFEGKSF
jgi:hypothetical protein